jgi:hypothetical protein
MGAGLAGVGAHGVDLDLLAGGLTTRAYGVLVQNSPELRAPVRGVRSSPFFADAPRGPSRIEAGVHAPVAPALRVGVDRHPAPGPYDEPDGIGAHVSGRARSRHA